MPTIYDLLAPIARSGLTWLSRRRLPQIEGTLHVDGLDGEVEILRDRWGVPHIYARDDHDLFFAQGFVHAQDRLFQMEMNRRVAQGTLSELFGEIGLETDRATRTFGFNRLAKTNWSSTSGQLREIILAYVEGVNAYLNHPERKLPVEFTLLNHTPGPWQPVDSLAFGQMMIWSLSHAWYSEIIRAQAIQAVGEVHAAELEISYPKSNPATLPSGIEFNILAANLDFLPHKGPYLSQGMGSNAWAVSRFKTENGATYLCNDMHLPLGIPSLWYENHLIGDNFNVTGVSLPGMPLVMVGHNADIAWGMTLAFTDCEDLFVEQFDPENPDQYKFKDQWQTAEVISEPIQVKGRKEPHIEEVILTHHGPVVSDIVGFPQQKLALQSMALQPCPAYLGWMMLDQARNWDDFVKAMHKIEAPQLNVAYADRHGNIGYWVTGRVPIRAKGDGRTPAAGWNGEYEWVSEVPFEEMPHALNPQKGLIVSCNHRIIPDDFPYYLGEAWMNGYRARRIVDYFESKEKLDWADLRDMQLDFTCLPGKMLTSHLAGLSSNDPLIALALECLRAWDGILTPDSVGGTLYEVTRYYLVRNLLEPGLGEALTLRLMGAGFHPVILPSHEFYGHDTVAILRMLEAPDSWWLNSAGGKEAVLLSSFKQAVAWLQGRLGDDIENWGWGKLHRAVFPHPLGLQKPLDQVFNRGPFPIGGDTDTPCQTALQPDDPYNVKAWAPSFRQIVDLSDLSRSVIIVPSGQSGHLGSSHYDDLIQPWLAGEYHPQLWTRQEIDKNAESKLRLTGKQ